MLLQAVASSSEVACEMRLRTTWREAAHLVLGCCSEGTQTAGPQVQWDVAECQMGGRQLEERAVWIDTLQGRPRPRCRHASMLSAAETTPGTTQKLTSWLHGIVAQSKPTYSFPMEKIKVVMHVLLVTVLAHTHVDMQ